MNLPFFLDEKIPGCLRPMILGVVVDDRGLCQFCGASRHRVSSSKRFDEKEKETRRKSADKYFPYDVKMTQCFLDDIAQEEEQKKVGHTPIVYVDEFDVELNLFLLGKRVEYHKTLLPEEKEPFTRLSAHWIVWCGPLKFNCENPDHIKFMCRG